MYKIDGFIAIVRYKNVYRLCCLGSVVDYHLLQTSDHVRVGEVLLIVYYYSHQLKPDYEANMK